MQIKKVQYISFSLWGNIPLYTVGTIRNAELIRTIYPDWKMIVYYDDQVPFDIIEELRKLNVELVKMTYDRIHPSFWRFYVLEREDCERAVFRDSDSRLSFREKSAVDEWILEGTVLHVMRDHPYHQIPYGANKLGILAGMWGLKGGTIKIVEQIEKFVQNNSEQEYGIDQAFLVSIYEEFYQDRTVHDEFFEGRIFPVPREGYRFVGERIDVNEEPLGDDWLEIKKWKMKRYKGLSGFIRRFFNK